MRHGIVCGLAAALLCACQPSAGAKTSTIESEMQPSELAVAAPAHLVRQPGQPMTLRELSKIVGATCDNPDTGDRCFGGDYDVELLPDCGSKGLFAGVIAPKGALLIDKAPPDDSVRRAMLSQGQLVCIQAIARAGASASYYYVVAVSKSDVAKCLANSECDRFDGHTVKWLVQHGDSACRRVASGRFDGDCAVGWVRESNLVIISGK